MIAKLKQLINTVVSKLVKKQPYEWIGVEGTLTLSQEKDCCDMRGGDEFCQTLKVELCDGGGGPFVRLSSTGWGFSPGEDKRLIRFLKGLVSVAGGLER